MDDIRKELTLMLLYLNSWEEGEPGYKYRRSWKGYDFGTLNSLADDELIIDGRRSKSVSLSANGEEKALDLLQKYGIDLERFHCSVEYQRYIVRLFC